MYHYEGAAPASAPPLIPEPPIANERIEFVRFGPDGSEEVVEGYVWGSAPPIRGMRCFWVLEVDSSGAVRANPAVAVVLASRRHRVGIQARVRTGRTVWIAKGGRFVDVGTAYTQTDPRSETGRLTANGANPPDPPTSIMVEALDPGTFARLSGDIEDEALLQ